MREGHQFMVSPQAEMMAGTRTGRMRKVSRATPMKREKPYLQRGEEQERRGQAGVRSLLLRWGARPHATAAQHCTQRHPH